MPSVASTGAEERSAALSRLYSAMAFGYAAGPWVGGLVGWVQRTLQVTQYRFSFNVLMGFQHAREEARHAAALEAQETKWAEERSTEAAALLRSRSQSSREAEEALEAVREQAAVVELERAQLRQWHGDAVWTLQRRGSHTRVSEQRAPCRAAASVIRAAPPYVDGALVVRDHRARKVERLAVLRHRTHVLEGLRLVDGPFRQLGRGVEPARHVAQLADPRERGQPARDHAQRPVARDHRHAERVHLGECLRLARVRRQRVGDGAGVVADHEALGLVHARPVRAAV